MNTDLYLGSNLIRNCDAALVINDVEVFRLRERTGDDQLIVDFHIRDQSDTKLAVIAKNNVVYAAEGFIHKNLAKESYVTGPDGKVLAKVVEISPSAVRVTGDFWISGYHVAISDASLVAGGVTLLGNTINGFGKAIVLRPGGFSIGTA